MSVPSATSTGSIGVEIDDAAGCVIASATATTADDAAGGPPAGVTFPHELIDLQLTGCSPGGTVDITVTYPSPLASGAAFWKWGPTPLDATPHWYTLESASIAGDTVTYAITDGGEGDDDLAINGTIDDPGGAGIAAAVPVMPMWTLALMGLALIGVARFVLMR